LPQIGKTGFAKVGPPADRERLDVIVIYRRPVASYGELDRAVGLFEEGDGFAFGFCLSAPLQELAPFRLADDLDEIAGNAAAESPAAFRGNPMDVVVDPA
jgi:hypothetical protein